MAINNEDKKDVSKHFGKAMANKIARATNDKKMNEKAWKSAGGFKSASEAISHPAFDKMHSAINRSTRLRRQARKGPTESTPADRGTMRSRVKGKLVDY